MRVLFCSAEVSPLAKVGGLADVAGSLPKALSKLGHDVRVVMPAYGYVMQNLGDTARVVTDKLFVRVNESRFVKATLWQAEVHGLNLWLIDGDDTFAQASKSEEVYAFGRDAYLFFAQAALEACQDTDWLPEIVHAHDWHMGFVPVFLRTKRSKEWHDTASIFTVHNLAYQGEFGFDTLDDAGLSHDYFHPDWLEAYGAVNFLKAGCVFADRTNTVSPTYAGEIQTPEFGCRLEGFMAHLSTLGRLSGILNGIDTDVFDPATDPRIPANYTVDDLSGKAACREAMISEAGLTISPDKPVFAVISRLSNQKGFDLMVDIAPGLMETGSAFVVLGTGDPWAASELRRLESAYPGQVKFFEKFDTDLAQRLYAGADAFLMPSSFEPCGLGQMFAMRYGTVPIVRSTGGLADTVHEGQNGFTFADRSSGELLEACHRAISAFDNPESWQNLVKEGMSADFSWDSSSKEYVALYQEALGARAAALQIVNHTVGS